VYFFSTKAFLISAIIIAKIVYLSFLTSCANRVTPIIWIFKILSELKSSLVFYLALGLILSMELILDLNSGFSSIFFIIEY